MTWLRILRLALDEATESSKKLSPEEEAAERCDARLALSQTTPQKRQHGGTNSYAPGAQSKRDWSASRRDRRRRSGSAGTCIWWSCMPGTGGGGGGGGGGDQDDGRGSHSSTSHLRLTRFCHPSNHPTTQRIPHKGPTLIR